MKGKEGERHHHRRDETAHEGKAAACARGEEDRGRGDEERGLVEDPVVEAGGGGEPEHPRGGTRRAAIEPGETEERGGGAGGAEVRVQERSAGQDHDRARRHDPGGEDGRAPVARELVHEQPREEDRARHLERRHDGCGADGQAECEERGLGPEILAAPPVPSADEERLPEDARTGRGRRRELPVKEELRLKEVGLLVLGHRVPTDDDEGDRERERGTEGREDREGDASPRALAQEDAGDPVASRSPHLRQPDTEPADEENLRDGGGDVEDRLVPGERGEGEEGVVVKVIAPAKTAEAGDPQHGHDEGDEQGAVGSRHDRARLGHSRGGQSESAKGAYASPPMKLVDLVRALESIAPTAYAEDWDNVGLLAGDPSSPLARVLLCIDCTGEVVAEAVETGCDAIVAYHPPLFRPVSRVTAGSVVYELVRRGIGLYSPHTALDAAAGGTNDVLADVIGMSADRAPIRASVPKDSAYKLVTFVPASALRRVSDAVFAAGAGHIGAYHGCSFRTPGTGTFFGEAGTSPAVGGAGTHETVEEVRLETVVPIDHAPDVVRALRASHPYEEPAFDLVRLAPPPLSKGGGMGRVGAVAPVERSALLARIKEGLGISRLLVAGPTDGPVTRAAVCAGAAGDLLDAAVRAGAELLVAGEVRHHDALRAAEAGVTVVCALHSNSERIALDPLRARIAAALPALAVSVSRVDRDPFTIV